ncbi:hypothetical protein Vretimale_19681 [Volvox reticuliferus]|uniref:Uncharacterized protein n=1 Tax=Volvox reticuliferus TaxID=1737510 RepID=A0A8J4M0T9_9CHLO|nr:hypothetical protein Vretimale_19681 [Volvox reticuliferus]
MSFHVGEEFTARSGKEVSPAGKPGTQARRRRKRSLTIDDRHPRRRQNTGSKRKDEILRKCQWKTCMSSDDEENDNYDHQRKKVRSASEGVCAMYTAGTTSMWELKE